VSLGTHLESFFSIDPIRAQALEALRRAFDSGFRDFRALELDPTFDPIREDLGFTTLIQKMQADLAQQRQRLADAGHLLTPEQVLAQLSP
jgi:hypothetical protein